MYYREDEDLNRDRMRNCDMIIDELLNLIDVFAYEYKWTEEKILKLTPVKRQELLKRITKRRESGSGDNTFGEE